MKEQRLEPEEDRARGEARSRTQARPPRTAPHRPCLPGSGSFAVSSRFLASPARYFSLPFIKKYFHVTPKGQAEPTPK